MSDLIAQFEAAAAAVQNLSKRPDNDTLLKLYSLYKQGSAGDVQGKRPGFTNIKGRAKYDAWKQLKGLAKEDAMRQYIDWVTKLQG
jgi:acyl-CoA-binding protein